MLCEGRVGKVATVLVAEDDEALAGLWREVLEGAGHEVVSAGDGVEALELASHENGSPARACDLLVCDVMLPGLDGFEVVRRLREGGSDMPVLFITARATLADKREGFAAGGDDYVVKPVDPSELLMRVSALLRRARIESERTLRVGSTTLDAGALTVTRDGESTELPPKEFALLFKLLASPGRVFTRRQLLASVWGEGSGAGDHTLDVHVSRLRERFAGNPDFTIRTVRGLGYKGVASDE